MFFWTFCLILINFCKLLLYFASLKTIQSWGWCSWTGSIFLKFRRHFKSKNKIYMYICSIRELLLIVKTVFMCWCSTSKQRFFLNIINVKSYPLCIISKWNYNNKPCKHIYLLLLLMRIIFPGVDPRFDFGRGWWVTSRARFGTPFEFFTQGPLTKWSHPWKKFWKFGYSILSYMTFLEYEVLYCYQGQLMYTQLIENCVSLILNCRFGGLWSDPCLLRGLGPMTFSLNCRPL